MSHFVISPPDVGQYYLKIYAKPEGEISNDNDTLDHVATFLIHTLQVIYTFILCKRFYLILLVFPLINMPKTNISL